MFSLAVFVAAILAGAVAAVSGFGIGSLLTPVFALRHPVNLAVAIVSIPHFIGTAVRFASMRQHIDRRVFLNFGIFSAAGGLLGALLSSRAKGPVLAIVFGSLLIFAGLTGLFGLTERMRFGRRTAWIAGAVSGFFGGLVGNQGGIRSAGLLGFDVRKEAMIATATAVALIVDGARMPVYLYTQWRAIFAEWQPMLIATIGVLGGTLFGVKLLRRIPEELFRKIVAVDRKSTRLNSSHMPKSRMPSSA